MAVVVEHKETREHYILLGAGLGAYKATRPSVFFGSLLPTEESGKITMLAVCNAQGQIGWIHSEEIEVVDIDGNSPAEVL